MSRVQAGDPDAADELIRHYEADIRLEVRVRMRVQDGRVRRMFDSMDITRRSRSQRAGASRLMGRFYCTPFELHSFNQLLLVIDIGALHHQPQFDCLSDCERSGHADSVTEFVNAERIDFGAVEPFILLGLCFQTCDFRVM